MSDEILPYLMILSCAVFGVAALVLPDPCSDLTGLRVRLGLDLPRVGWPAVPRPEA